MQPNELRSLVALMRELGIVHYENSDLQIVLGPAPILGASEAAGQGPSAGLEAEGTAEAIPEAYRRLPVAYRNEALWGGKLPKL